CRVDRLRAVADMDAVEPLARLDDALRGAVLKLRERTLPRSVDAGEPQNRHRPASVGAEPAPAVLREKPLAAARIDRRRRRRLVDPATVVTAVDADGREIDNRCELRRAPARPNRKKTQHRGTALPRRARESSA